MGEAFFDGDSYAVSLNDVSASACFDGVRVPTLDSICSGGDCRGVVVLVDGAGAVLLGSKEAGAKHGLKPRAKIRAFANIGSEPAMMLTGPVDVTEKLFERSGMKKSDIDLFELNEAFAAQALAVLRDLGLPDDAARVNPNGGGIAIGHPLGMSGARLVTTAVNQLHRTGGRYGLCTMCIGVGQGIAMIVERV